MLSRETLLWTNFLNRCPAPLSRSPILHSSPDNCSSLQTNAFFLCNALKTRDCLGISICFDKRRSVDSRRDTEISLALANSMTMLQSAGAFFAVFLKRFLDFFTKRV
ncbi:hypothetical protein TRIUR3_00092 [Triticum urartu]|uniref:Uncharacterized protein n=2 Tax=Triticum TaxID=4564 RepID=A0A9R0S309_TRITD|nr:hypothetical protein TRIUR3_00092 [Triticum urartu]VAH69230.1 unnamed protein product [Triticum turgidum subsp. durum]